MARSFTLLTTALLLTVLAMPVAASAQTDLSGRVNRLEGEMRAVQRKVFPEGAGRYLEPQVTAPTGSSLAGSPATSPLADLESRVSAIEAQLRSLTGQVEQNGYRLRQLEQAFDQYKASQAVAAASPAVPAAPAPAAPVTSGQPAPKPAPAAKGTDLVRAAAVAAVERPSTGSPADDAYAYGYRLWAAKFYPEAQVQLKTTVDKYPGASVASRAENLLGRAYLDDGKPALAAVSFYENYKKRPQGDRASDSLAYLGEALIQLKKLPDACKVYSELQDIYGATLRADLRTMMEKGRIRAKCGA